MSPNEHHLRSTPGVTLPKAALVCVTFVFDVLHKRDNAVETCQCGLVRRLGEPLRAGVLKTVLDAKNNLYV